MLRVSAILVAVLLSFLAGCGGGPGYPAARIAGQVTVDDEPLETGFITFQPLEKDRGPATGTEIHGGRYDCGVVPLGKVRVTFQADKKTGKIIKEPGREYAEVVSAIPPAEQQGREIDVQGDNLQQDFALKSK